MKILSVNLGRGEVLPGRRSEADATLTGIYKRPVDGPVRITREGVVGDTIGDPRYHGGPDQAVYLYAQADYAWWESTLGRPLEPGTFGENLTLDELDTAKLAVGDRLRIGVVLLEITAPRVPCGTLSRRMEDTAFLKKFRAAERPGPYCRVLEEGGIRAGDEAQFVPYAGERVTLLELYRAVFTPPREVAIFRRHLAAPLAGRFREMLAQNLASLEAKGGASGEGA
jgi:MOSC domain-containing protein YiiM